MVAVVGQWSKRGDQVGSSIQCLRLGGRQWRLRIVLGVLGFRLGFLVKVWREVMVVGISLRFHV